MRQTSAVAPFTGVDESSGLTLGRITRVTLRVEEDAHEYPAEDKFKETPKKFLQFIQFPTCVNAKKEVQADSEEGEYDDDEKEEEQEPVEPAAGGDLAAGLAKKLQDQVKKEAGDDELEFEDPESPEREEAQPDDDV